MTRSEPDLPPPARKGRGVTKPDLSHIDFEAKAQRMHRRAQEAEARAERILIAYQQVFASRERARAQLHTKDRKLQRQRVQLRACRHRDPLTRIIEIGRQFP